MSKKVSEEFIQFCKSKLLQMKMDLLNFSRTSLQDLKQAEVDGRDEIDLMVRTLSESQLLIHQERTKNRLYEIEHALAKIERGAFGICEETLEPIEEARLRTLPFTRWSIEGAEILESKNQKFTSG